MENRSIAVALLAMSGSAIAQTNYTDAFYQHSYFKIYLAGCAAWVVFAIFKVLLIYFLRWASKGNIYAKNMAKVSAPDNRPSQIKCGLVGVFTLIEAAFSWLGLVINIGHLLVFLFRFLRELFTAVPEEIKRLNFPFLNNPQLSREAVWAYMYAAGTKAGTDPTDDELMRLSLGDVSGWYSDFDQKDALKRLGTLNVVSDQVITAVLKYKDNWGEDSTWDEVS